MCDKQKVIGQKPQFSFLTATQHFGSPFFFCSFLDISLFGDDPSAGNVPITMTTITVKGGIVHTIITDLWPRPYCCEEVVRKCCLLVSEWSQNYSTIETLTCDAKNETLAFKTKINPNRWAQHNLSHWVCALQHADLKTLHVGSSQRQALKLKHGHVTEGLCAAERCVWCKLFSHVFLL